MNELEPAVPEYPEHIKMQKVFKTSQAIGEFLEWLRGVWNDVKELGLFGLTLVALLWMAIIAFRCSS